MPLKAIYLLDLFFGYAVSVCHWYWCWSQWYIYYYFFFFMIILPLIRFWFLHFIQSFSTNFDYLCGVLLLCVVVCYLNIGVRTLDTTVVWLCVLLLLLCFDGLVFRRVLCFIVVSPSSLFCEKMELQFAQNISKNN